MIEYKYSLDEDSDKHICPNCQRKRLVLYVDNETGEYLNDNVGRCDREIKCKYHYPPKLFFEKNSHLQQNYSVYGKHRQNNYQFKSKVINGKTLSIDYIDKSMVNNCFNKNKYEPNYFVEYMTSILDTNTVQELRKRFFIGTSTHWKGATIFWQIDCRSKVRTGKIMLYDRSTGKRIKKPHNHINWVHSILKKSKTIKEFNLTQCLFGEHQLITTPKNTMIALVESEKTAILMSAVMPQYIWLAVGSLNGLNSKRCNSIKDRNIILFPDLNAFDQWEKKASDLKHDGFKIIVSDILERFVVNKLDKGLDLADFFKVPN